MSKDKYRMTRKRIEKKLAAKCGVQVREVHEVIMKDVVNPLKRRQEAWQTAKHRYAQQEVRPVTKQYIYSLYDAKTGALRAKGTPQELMEQDTTTALKAYAQAMPTRRRKRQSRKSGGWNGKKSSQSRKQNRTTGPAPRCGRYGFTACLTRTETCCTKARPQSW